MVLSFRQFHGLVVASVSGWFVLSGAPTPSDAASASTSGVVGVTISTSGGVSTPDPEPEDTTNQNQDVVVEQSDTGSTSGSTIVVTPADPTSNLGFSPVAPGGQQTSETSGSGSSSSSSSSTASGTSSAPRFSSSQVTTQALGAASGVSVAGAPNQTFSFILPELTVYASLGQVVTLSNFQHTGGATPFLGNDGSGFFNIGAQMNQSPISAQIRPNGQNGNENADQNNPTNLNTITSSLSDVSLIGGDLPSILASAFTYRSPYVNIVISYY